jgi:hypothetical protein
MPFVPSKERKSALENCLAERGSSLLTFILKRKRVLGAILGLAVLTVVIVAPILLLRRKKEEPVA